MDLSKLPNPPVSQKLLSKLYTIFIKESAFLNKNITLVSFSGSGHLAQLKYLTQQLPKLTDYPENHIFTVLDLGVCQADLTLGFGESVNYIKSYYGHLLNEETLLYIDDFLNVKEITFSKFDSLLRKITYDSEIYITFILDHVDVLYFNAPKTLVNNSLLKLLENLVRINPMKTSFILLPEAEFTVEEIYKIPELSKIFMDRLVWGSDFLFDTECVDVLLDTQETWHNQKYLDEFRDVVKVLCVNDPSLCKHVAVLGLGNEEFQKELITHKKMEFIYEHVNADWVENRYRKVTNKLSNKSLECINEKSHPSEFLTKLGLFSVHGSSIKSLNPVFEHFISLNRPFTQSEELINSSTLVNNVEPQNITGANLDESVEFFRKELTGKELMVFNQLYKYKGEIVTREDIAIAMWGDSWEKSYSEWGIDKIVSEIRKKLLESDLHIALTTVKKEGYILI